MTCACRPAPRRRGHGRLRPRLRLTCPPARSHWRTRSCTLTAEPEIRSRPSQPDAADPLAAHQRHHKQAEVRAHPRKAQPRRVDRCVAQTYGLTGEDVTHVPVIRFFTCTASSLRWLATLSTGGTVVLPRSRPPRLGRRSPARRNVVHRGPRHPLEPRSPRALELPAPPLSIGSGSPGPARPRCPRGPVSATRKRSARPRSSRLTA